MEKAKKIRNSCRAALIGTLLLSGVAVWGLVMGTAQLAFSQADEPKCVCAECDRPCGSGHASGCSSAPK